MQEGLSKKVYSVGAILYLMLAIGIGICLIILLGSNVSKYSVDSGTVVFWFSLGISFPTGAFSFLARKRMKEILKDDEASNWELRLFHSKEYKNLNSWKNASEVTFLVACMFAATLLLS